ncbi:MAG: hypothetical protein Q4E80_01705 [Slackia faecicanis]|nr:hypothetical protein [Slackia faecicanis]
MDISNQIKKRRTDMGLSQEELAERIYVRARPFRTGKPIKPTPTSRVC